MCAEAGIAWERPRNLIFERFPAVMGHYLLCPVKASPPRLPPTPPPPRNQFPVQPPPPPPDPVPVQPASSVRGQVGEFFRYTFDGFRESACDQG